MLEMPIPIILVLIFVIVSAFISLMVLNLKLINQRVSDGHRASDGHIDPLTAKERKFIKEIRSAKFWIKFWTTNVVTFIGPAVGCISWAGDETCYMRHVVCGLSASLITFVVASFISTIYFICKADCLSDQYEKLKEKQEKHEEESGY
jgi:hypothetical protein